MDRSPAVHVSSVVMWRAVTAALILVVLVTATVFVTTVHRQGKGEGELQDGTQRTGNHRQRRDAEKVAEATTRSTSGVETDPLTDNSADYFPVYREVGGRSIDWNGEQMSTDGFDVQSRTDFIDDEDYDESASLDTDYDYTDDIEQDQDTPKYNAADVQTDKPEEFPDEGVNSSLPRGKEFSDYYADFDDGQKFDEDQYETTFIKPGMHYGDNVEIVEQVMVRGDNRGVGRGARRIHLASRRRRRRRPRPLRRRRVRIARRRIPRRMLRVPRESSTRLNRIQLSRDNIQLHPRVRRTQLTSASSSVPRVLSYASPARTQYVPRATGAEQYVTVDDYAGYRVPHARPIVIQLQKPLSSSSTIDNHLGLVEDIRVIGLADRKATTSVVNQQVGNFGNYARKGGREVVTLQQSPQDFTWLPSMEVSSKDEQPAGGGVQLVVPVKSSVGYLSPSAVQVVTAETDDHDLTLLPVQTVHDQQPAHSHTSGTLRTLPEGRTSSPTYIILRLSGDDDDDASGKIRRGSSGAIVAGQSVDLGDKIKYIDLSELVSNSHLSVTSSQPRKTPRLRLPKSQQQRPPARPRSAAKPTRRRPPQPPSPARAPPTPSSPPRQRPPRPPPPPRPVPPPAPSQESSNDRQQFDLSGYNSDRHRYPPSPSHHHHHHHHHHQQQQQHQQRQQQQQYSPPDEQLHPSHMSSRYEEQSEAIMPIYRPTPL